MFILIKQATSASCLSGGRVLFVAPLWRKPRCTMSKFSQVSRYGSRTSPPSITREIYSCVEKTRLVTQTALSHTLSHPITLSHTLLTLSHFITLLRTLSHSLTNYHTPLTHYYTLSHSHTLSVLRAQAHRNSLLRVREIIL